MTTSMGAAAADGLRDAIALVQARSRGDLAGLWAVLGAYHEQDSTGVLLGLVELCAGLLAETGTDTQAWAQQQRAWLGTDWEQPPV